MSTQNVTTTDLWIWIILTEKSGWEWRMVRGKFRSLEIVVHRLPTFNQPADKRRSLTHGLFVISWNRKCWELLSACLSKTEISTQHTISEKLLTLAVLCKQHLIYPSNCFFLLAQRQRRHDLFLPHLKICGSGVRRGNMRRWKRREWFSSDITISGCRWKWCGR